MHLITYLACDLSVKKAFHQKKINHITVEEEASSQVYIIYITVQWLYEIQVYIIAYHYDDS